MCNTWQFPTRPEEEITSSDLESLPRLQFCNITGGEPFVRSDIADFVRIMSAKSKRVVISTNGYFTDKIVGLVREFPKTGVRVSIEGTAGTNDRIRGLKEGFERGVNTLNELQKLGSTDVGFGITLSDDNIDDLMQLYELAEKMKGIEFATACVHNTYYFHKSDNKITRRDAFVAELEKLMTALLKSRRAKNWFRAYFNYGLLNRALGRKRLLPCRMGFDVFFIDPFGEVMPCNGMEMSMGNVRKEPFEAIWNGSRAREVRSAVDSCRKECWMVGSAAPAMKRDIIKPIMWVVKNKVRLAFNGKIDTGLKP